MSVKSRFKSPKYVFLLVTIFYPIFIIPAIDISTFGYQNLCKITRLCCVMKWCLLCEKVSQRFLDSTGHERRETIEQTCPFRSLASTLTFFSTRSETVSASFCITARCRGRRLRRLRISIPYPSSIRCFTTLSSRWQIA